MKHDGNGISVMNQDRSCEKALIALADIIETNHYQTGLQDNYTYDSYLPINLLIYPVLKTL